jgi:glycogen(starch) synthase
MRVTGSDRVRIIHISSLWPPVVLGGAEIYAARLALEQEKAGHTVGVITQGVPGDGVVEVVPPWPYRLETFADQPAGRRAIFHGLDLYNPFAGRRMRRAIRRFAPDVIHSHFVAGLSTAALTTGATTAARVHHLHGYWLMCRRTTMVRPNGDPCHDVSCRAVMATRSAILRHHPPDLLLGPSQTVIDAHARFSWAAGRMRHVPHPLDEVPSHRSPATSPPGGPTTFGYLGQLSELKGIPTLLDAFAALAGEGHRLLVGGRGPLLSYVERAGPGVEALGWLDDDGKEGFFAKIHCLIVPSTPRRGRSSRSKPGPGGSR